MNHEFWDILINRYILPNVASLKLISDLHHFGFLRAEDVQKIALEGIKAGIDDEELFEIDSMRKPNLRDLDDVFDRWLKKHGQALEPKEQAGISLAKFICALIVKGEVSPFDGGKIIWQDIYNQCRELKELFPFVSNASAYEDCLEIVHEEKREYLENIMRLAKELI